MMQEVLMANRGGAAKLSTRAPLIETDFIDLVVCIFILNPSS